MLSVVLWAAEQIARGEEPRAQPSSPLVYRPVEALPRQDVRPVARERGREREREREMGKELWDADRKPPSLGNMATTHQQNVSIVCRDPLTRDAAGRQPVRHLHTCNPVFFTLLLHFWFNDLQSSPCTGWIIQGHSRTRRRDEVTWLASPWQTDGCRAACHGRHGQGAPLRRRGQDAKPCRTPRREGRQGCCAHRCLDALRGRWPPR